MCSRRRWLEDLPDIIKEFLGHHVTDAGGRSTAAWVIAKICQIITVIEGDLFTRPDRAAGHDPDMAIDQLGFAIGRTTMIDELGGIPADIPIDVALIVD